MRRARTSASTCSRPDAGAGEECEVGVGAATERAQPARANTCSAVQPASEPSRPCLCQAQARSRSRVRVRAGGAFAVRGCVVKGWGVMGSLSNSLRGRGIFRGRLFLPAGRRLPGRVLRVQASSTVRAVASQPGSRSRAATAAARQRVRTPGSDSQRRSTSASGAGSVPRATAVPGRVAAPCFAAGALPPVRRSPGRRAGGAGCERFDGAGAGPDHDGHTPGNRFRDHEPVRLGLRDEQAEVGRGPFGLERAAAQLPRDPDAVLQPQPRHRVPELRGIGRVRGVGADQGRRPRQVRQG